MSQHPQVTQETNKSMLLCNDLHCKTLGNLCCLNCKHQDTCPNKCPTVQQLQNPEYEGCPHLDVETNTQKNDNPQHFYDTLVNLTTLDDLSDTELKVLKHMVIEFLETQCITGCVVVQPSRRRPDI